MAKCFFSVYAVQNGKIVSQREAIHSNSNRSQDNDSQDKSLVPSVSLPKSISADNVNLKSGLFSRHKTLKKNCEACASAFKLPENYSSQSQEELSGNGSVSNRLELVPFQTSEDNAVLVRKLPGWSLLLWVFLPKRHHSENSSPKKSADQWVLSKSIPVYDGY